MAIKSKLMVNQTYQVYINGDGDLAIDNDCNDLVCTVDVKDVPDLLKAIEMVMDEHMAVSQTKNRP